MKLLCLVDLVFLNLPIPRNHVGHPHPMDLDCSVPISDFLHFEV